MKTGIRKLLSLVSAATLAATTIATSIVLTTSAAVEKPASYEFQIPISEATLVDAAEGSRIGADRGVWSIYNDAITATGGGAAVTDGSLIFYSPLAITDYSFNVLQGGPENFTFQASVDGLDGNWVDITPEDEMGASFNWGAYWHTRYGQFSVDQDIHYLRVNLKANATGLFPGLEYVKFNAPHPGTYDTNEGNRYGYRLSPTDATLEDAVEGAVVKQVNKGAPVFSIFDQNDNVTTGSLIFYSELPITDYMIRTINGPAGWDTVTYSASTTGEAGSWVPATMLNKQMETHSGGWGTNYWNRYGRFTVEQDIHYLRVTIEKDSDLYPGVDYVQFNVAPAGMADVYNNRVDASQATAASEDGTPLASIAELGEFRNFQGKPGTLTVYSDVAITDYNFRTLVADDGFGGGVTFYASTDGTEDSWEVIDPQMAKVESHSASWGNDYKRENYGSFAAEENIHYIRVELNATGAFANLPAVHYIEYNTIQYTINTGAQVDVKEPLSTVPAEGFGESPDLSYDSNKGQGFSFGTATAGEAIYQVPKSTGLKATGIINGTAGGRLQFQVSSNPDGEWTDLPVSFTRETASLSNPAFYGVTYTGISEEVFEYVKVIFPARNGYAPYITNLYLDIIDSEFEAQYDNVIAANDPSVTVSAGANTALKETDVLAEVDPGSKYYTFVEETTTTPEGSENPVTTSKGVGGTLDFKADNKYFINVAVKAAVGPGDSIDFYKSADGLMVTRDDFKVSNVSVRKIADLPGGGSLNYYYFTLPISEEIRMIRVVLNKAAGDTSVGLPAIASLLFDSVDALEYAYKIGAGDYYEAVPAGESTEGVTFGSGAANAYLFLDGNTPKAGAVTYKSDYPISQYNFRVLRSTTDPTWVNELSYWVSKDGKTYVQLQPKSDENADGYSIRDISDGNPSWGAAKYSDIYGDLDAAEGYYYLQVRMAGNGLPDGVHFGVQYVQFNTEGEPESYTYTLGPAQAYEAEGQDGGTLTNFEGVYLFRDENGADTAGTLTFAAPYYFEDFSIRVVMPNAGQCDAGIRFEAYTADGTLVEDFKPMISRDVRHSADWADAFFDIVGKLDESDGVKFIKVVFTGGGDNKLPAITEFKYNLPDQPGYTEQVSPSDGVAESELGELVTGETEIPEYYIFMGDVEVENPEGGTSISHTSVPGTVTFHSELAITDFNFRVLEADNGFGGNITYSASTDGSTWTPIRNYAALKVGVQSPSWGPGYIKHVYGAFTPEDDIHYLRVELNNNMTFAKQPALAYVQYNMDGVIRPDIYRYQQSAQDATADAEGTLTATAADSEYFNFQQNSSAVDGSLVFEAENFITDLSINMLNGDEAEYYYSADGTEWTAFVPEVEADGDYAEYYTKFPNSQVARFIRVDLKGDAAISGIVYNTGARYYEQLPNTSDIEDLDLPQKDSPFATGSYGESIFKLSSMTITNNGAENGPYIGGDLGNYGMVQTSQDGEIIFYTPGMKDFKFISAYPGDGIATVQYKAYGRKTQYGEETEIPLMRTEIRDAGFDHSQYRPTEEARETLDDYLYLRIEGKIEYANMVQLLDFTFFYDGEEPGPVPDDEHAGGEGTDRTNVNTYNFIKGNMNPLRSENMIPVTNAIGNVDYIGTEQGYVVDAEGQDGFVTFRADGITYFYVKVHMIPEYVGNLNVKILVAPEDDDSQYVEIPLKYELTKDQPTGWISVEYMPADGAVIPAGSNYIKYLIEDGDRSSQLVRIDYEYEIPEVQRLPDWTEPDSANNQKELLDRFEGNGITTAQGGLAYDMFQMSILGSYNLGGENGSARVIAKDNPFSDGSVYYQVDANIDSIDVRGYRIVGFEDLPLVWVSADGEDWTLLEDGEALTVPLFDGPQEFSWQLTNIPDGMRYVRVDIPDLENSTDLVLHGIQILYGSGSIDNVDTGVALPLAALALAGASGAAVLVSRKRRRNAK